MTAPNYPQMAALVYGKCVAYDPYLAEPSEETSLAWAEQFALGRFELPDLMAAVTKVYSEHGNTGRDRYRPLPKDICDAARAIRDDRAKRRTVDDTRALAGPAPATAEARRRAIAQFAASVAKVPAE